MPTRTTTVTTYGPDGKVTGTTTQTYDVTAEQDNRETIVAQAAAAMAANRGFLSTSPAVLTDLTTQVKALTRQNNKIIRLLLGVLDATD